MVSQVADALRNEGKLALYGITFEFNSAKIQEASKPTIELIAEYLKAYAQSEILVVGHTDNAGALDFNMDLSKKRADAVINSLITDYKIDKKRLTAVGVGMAAPLASNASEDGRKVNRRVEVALR